MFDPLGANNVNHNLNNTSDNVINHEIVTKLQQKSEDQDMRKNKINNDSVFLKVIDFEKTKMLHKESKKNEKKLEKSEKLKSSSLTNNDDQKFEFGGFKLNDSPTRIGNKEDGDALNAITSNNVNNNTNNQDNSNSLFDDSPIAPKSITSTINNNNNNNSIKTATVTRRTSTVAYENSNDNDNVDDLKISKTLLIREDRKADADMFGTSFTANKLKGDKKKLKREETHTEETTSELNRDQTQVNEVYIGNLQNYVSLLKLHYLI